MTNLISPDELKAQSENAMRALEELKGTLGGSVAIGRNR
jgi:hypothetical protein